MANYPRNLPYSVCSVIFPKWGLVALSQLFPILNIASVVPSFPVFRSSFFHLWEDEFTSQLQDVSSILGLWGKRDLMTAFL